MAMDVGDLVWYRNRTLRYDGRSRISWWPGTITGLDDDLALVEPEHVPFTKLVSLSDVVPRDPDCGGTDRPPNRNMF